MSGVLDFLFGGGAAPGPTNVTTAVSGLPDYYQTYQAGLLNKGNEIAAAPYTQYTGQRVASLTPDQQAANTSVENLQGIQQPYLDQSAALNANVGAGFNQNDFNSYLSPYTGGVVDAVARLGQRNLTQNLLPAVNSTFTGAGMFGSSRNADFTGRAVQQANESILNQQAQSLQDAYSSAMGNYQTGQSQKLNAANNFSNLGSTAQQLAINQATALGNVGALQQGQNQKNLDQAYSDFQTQQQYPMQQLYMLSDLLHGTASALPKTTTVTQQGVNQQSSPLGSIASGLSQYNTGATS